MINYRLKLAQAGVAPTVRTGSSQTLSVGQFALGRLKGFEAYNFKGQEGKSVTGMSLMFAASDSSPGGAITVPKYGRNALLRALGVNFDASKGLSDAEITTMLEGSQEFQSDWVGSLVLMVRQQDKPASVKGRNDMAVVEFDVFANADETQIRGLVSDAGAVDVFTVGGSSGESPEPDVADVDMD